MSKALILFFAFLAFLSCSAKDFDAKPGDRINGIWMTDARDAEIQVYRLGNYYYGKIIWLKETSANGKPLLDSLHPNPKLRNRTRVNIVALTGMTCNDENRYENGVLYYPTNGRTYKCKATLLNSNELELRIFIGVKLLGKTTVFTRVS